MVEALRAEYPVASKASVMSKLLALEPKLRAQGATSLHVFGSVARDETHAHSDIDVFIDYDPNGAFSLLELVSVQDFLRQEFGRKVDVITRNGLHPLLKDRIVKSSLRVF